MAASNGPDSTGRKNYYGISYGMLGAMSKEAPEGYEIIELADIKSRRTKNENVDLRRKYYDTANGKDYPFKVFYTDITGIIESVEKDKYEKGTSLKLVLHDTDGDESIVQTDFYGKVCADLLNRLLSVNPASELNFRPYSIPSSFDLNGKTINFYSSGVSIKDAGVKIDRKYKGKDSGLPATAQVQNSKGEDETSRVAQINFLWEQVEAKFAEVNADSGTKTPAQKEEVKTESTAQKVEEPAVNVSSATGTSHDDLPF
jgi:hypothetical protein